MTRTALADPQTYLPSGDEQCQILEFTELLRRTGKEPLATRPVLIDASGHRTEIPAGLVEPLRQVAEALSRGQGVTIAPRTTRLTTQQAADFLGVSRPTLVRMLERGDLEMERPARHRYVRLDDLVAFQVRMRTQRSASLDSMTQISQELGLYDTSDDQPLMR